ncbi:hypothetical protein ABZW10_06510 [Kitasatospora sp. NPDC004723]|uniref:hypothetical protein n=1 Tax=Kitasatospora sp. NPDC004723 TaxID=3154288 RepID=UPI0033A8F639
MPARSRGREARRLLALPLVLTAVLAAACSSGDGSGAGGDAQKEPAVASTPELLDANQAAYPLQAFSATAAQIDQLTRAQDVLVDQCMQRFGFRFTPEASTPVADTGRNTFRYGTANAETASRNGYNRPELAQPPRPRPNLGPNEQRVLHGEESLDPKSLPKSQEEADRQGGSADMINGLKVPIGGCLRESFLKLHAPKPNSIEPQYVFNLEQQANSSSRTDSRVAAAVSAWSACMAEKGYQSTNPVSPAQDLGLSGAAASGPEAIAAATTDVECKRKVNLVGIWSTVEAAYQQRLVEKNAETLRLARAQLDESLRLATSLLR